MLQTEANQLVEEIDMIASTTVYNNQKLIGFGGILTNSKDGFSFKKNPNPLKFQIGPNEGDIIVAELPYIKYDYGLGIIAYVNYISTVTIGKYEFDLTDTTPLLTISVWDKFYSKGYKPLSGLMDRKSAEEGITVAHHAIDLVSRAQAHLGALQNRLTFALFSDWTSEIEHRSTHSRIRDIDLAEKMMNIIREWLLARVSTSMLNQINLLMERNILPLLR
jgi:flagellin-like hook-associated protein FlgL